MHRKQQEKVMETIKLVSMSNTVENDFFGFPKVQWFQYTGKVGKCTSCRCQICSGFHTPKIIKIG